MNHDQPCPVIPVHPEEVYSELTCAICLNVPLHPVMTSCQHLFCRDCLAQYQQQNEEISRCPTCRVESPQRPAALVAGSLVYRIWSKTNARCGNCDRGCPWIGSISDLEAHYQACRPASNASTRNLQERSEKLEYECEHLKSAVATAERNRQNIKEECDRLKRQHIGNCLVPELFTATTPLVPQMSCSFRNSFRAIWKISRVILTATKFSTACEIATLPWSAIMRIIPSIFIRICTCSWRSAMPVPGSHQNNAAILTTGSGRKAGVKTLSALAKNAKNATICAL